MAYHLRFFESAALDPEHQDQWEAERVDVAKKCAKLLALANEQYDNSAHASTSNGIDAYHVRSTRLCGAGSRLENCVISLSVDDVVMQCDAQPSVNAANALTRHTLLSHWDCLKVGGEDQTHVTKPICIIRGNGPDPTSISTHAARPPMNASHATTSGQSASSHAKSGESASSHPLQTISIGLTCLMTVLEQLSRDQPEVCLAALTSLQQLLQSMAHDTLRTEPYEFVKKMFDLLRSLRLRSGSRGVRQMSTQCMVALAVAFGLPEMLLLAVEALVCDEREGAEEGSDDEEESTVLPVNYLDYASNMLGVVGTHDWLRTAVTDNHVLVSTAVKQMDDDDDATVVVLVPGAASTSAACITSDGAYLYVLTRCALVKMGTGTRDTIHGHVYAYNTNMHAAPGTWMGVCQNSLYLRRRHSTRLWVLATDTLTEIGEVLLPTATAGDGLLYTDGEGFRLAMLKGNTVTWHELDDNFAVVDTPSSDSPADAREMCVDLSTTVYVTHGQLPIYLTADATTSHLCMTAKDIQFAADVAFLLTDDGNVYYMGRGSVYGLADSTSTWLHLSVVKDSIQSMRVALDSNNAAFLTAAGGELWVANGMQSVHGLALQRIGVAQQLGSWKREILPNAAPSTLPRITRVTCDHHPRRTIIAYAINASSLAYVTDNGRVFMMGKHVMHCDADSGQVNGLDHVHMATVSLGKTHCVGITRHGLVYTWGLNNMYQCGREDQPSTVTPSTVTPSSGIGGGGSTASPSTHRKARDTLRLCAPGNHMWVVDVATVCSACRQCSVHGRRCTRRVTIAQDGEACSAAGESGCLRCGVCRACGETRATHDDDQSTASTTTATTMSDRGTVNRRMVLTPAKVSLGGGGGVEPKVVKVQCGNYHTLVLCDDGSVFTFGSNCHGQLGLGDIRRRVTANKLEMQCSVVALAAGANHSCLTTDDGRVITFGSDKQGQLGREAEEKPVKYAHALCVEMGGVGGVDCTRNAVHVMCGVDYTVVKCTQRIMSDEQFDATAITGDMQIRMMFAHQSNEYIVVRFDADGAADFTVHGLPGHLVHTESAWCLDTAHDLLWCFDAENHLLLTYSPSRTTRRLSLHNRFLRSHEFMLPRGEGEEVSASNGQLALTMLATLYANTMDILHPTEPSVQSNATSINLGDDGEYSTLERFHGFGGGWGYSAQSTEAIQFSANRDFTVGCCNPRRAFNFFQLHGCGLFGGRGQYVVRLRLLRSSGGDNGEGDVVVADSDDAVYECAPKEKAVILFARPVVCVAQQWYTIHARIYGPCSDCGASGQTVVQGDGALVVNFRNSALSNNGTDVNAGQIAQLLYSVPDDVDDASNVSSMDNYKSTSLKLASNYVDNQSALTPKSNLTITPMTVKSVLRILRSVLDEAFIAEEPTTHSSAEQRAFVAEGFISICVMLLRLLREYIGLLYPVDGPTSRSNLDNGSTADWVEPSAYMCHVSELCTLLQSIYSRGPTAQIASTSTIILEEAIETHVLCSHVLSPCVALTQHRLAQLIAGTSRDDWPLVATLQSMCTARRPLATMLLDDESAKGGRYPLLIRHMFKHLHVKQVAHLNYASVLRFLMELCFAPATPDDAGIAQSHLRDAASRILAKIAQELASTAGASTEAPIVQSKSRFGQRSTTTNWDASTSSTDAIAFRVDDASITLHGVGLFVGDGAEYSYTVDVLLNQSGGNSNDTWHIVEKCSGSVQIDYATSSTIVVAHLAKPVKLHPNCLYAVRLCMNGTSKTYSGEAGNAQISLLGGGTITYLPCVGMSANGTNVCRGQIPCLRYSQTTPTHDERLNKVISTEDAGKYFLMLLRALCLKLLDCLTVGCVPCNQWLFASIFGWTGVFLEHNAARALDVIAAVDELLPVVAAANGQRSNADSSKSCTSSGFSTNVDSPHPYVLGSMHAECVTFDGCTDYVSVEFDAQCRTACSEHVLSVFVRTVDAQFVQIGKYAMSQWPRRLLLVPGNAVWFVLETTAADVHDEIDRSAEAMFGFACVVTGYRSAVVDPLLQLEQELSWLCASACGHLLRSSGTNDVTSTTELMNRHGVLLRRGLHLAHTPTVGEAVARKMPSKAQYPQLKFLHEFTICSPHTTAGRLARWLSAHQPFVDVHQCEMHLVDEEDVLVGRSTMIRLVIKDQFGRHAKCVQPISIDVSVRMGANSNSCLPSTNEHLPSLVQLTTQTYQPTYMNKARYMCISMMPVYSTYSLEELRMAYFRDSVTRESVTMKVKGDGSYVGRWIGRHMGVHRIECRLDGMQLTQSIQIDVMQNTPHSDVQSAVPRRVAQLSRTRTATIGASTMTAGVRMRASPSLHAHVMGHIPRGNTVTYVESVNNGDGLWLRLTDDACIQFCQNMLPNQQPSHAWVLQYNSQLKHSILELHDDPPIRGGGEAIAIPVTSMQNLHMDDYLDASHSIIVSSDDVYSVHASHARLPVRAQPTQNSTVVAWLTANDVVHTDGWMHNSGGVWVRLKNGYCLAQSIDGTVFLTRKVGSPTTDKPMETVDERGRPLASVAPNQRSTTSSTHQRQVTLIRAMSPSVADATRATFAAFVWHEQLVNDATACAAYLKYHPELHAVTSPPPIVTPRRRPSESAATSVGSLSTSSVCGTPTALQPLLKVWKDVEAAIMTVIEHNHMNGNPTYTPGGTGIRGGGGSAPIAEELCELCEEVHPMPITSHLRAAHGGCGEQCNGYGYNAVGRYTTGWSGTCGEGGSAPASDWYLLCRQCRQTHLQCRTMHEGEEEAKDTANWPQTIVKRNAAFLLELNNRTDVTVGETANREQSVSQWTINMFPSLDTPPLVQSAIDSAEPTQRSVGVQCKTAQHATTSTDETRQATASHISDPGPAHQGGRSLQHADTSLATVTQSMQYKATPLAGSPSHTLNAFVKYERGVLRRPVIVFCVGRHQLLRIRQSMQTAVHRATLLQHVFKVFNWMLRLVSCEGSVKDVLWLYIKCMSQFTSSSPSPVLPHPWRLCLMAGPMCNPMIGQYHGLLQTISVILRSAAVTGHLQRICYRAWTFQLTVHEQDLLMLTCDILSTVANTLAADTQSMVPDDDEGEVGGSVDVQKMVDIAGTVHTTASSRNNMTSALFDGTLDTFWESGEADKSRVRSISLQWTNEPTIHVTLLCVYIHNARDAEYRTQHVQVMSRRRRVGEHVLHASFSGWLKYSVAGSVDRVTIELRGNDNACRVRGIQLLATGTQNARSMRLSASHQLAFNAVQTDAFALFQSIAGQVFNEQFTEQSGNIRHQVLDMLFSSRHLHPLQTYVCQQIVHAVEKEVHTLKIRQGKRNYSYVCGLLVMLTKIGRSRSGVDVLAQRSRLLVALTELLLFSSSVVQCQVLDAIEKTVGLFDPRLCDARSVVENLLVLLGKQASMQMRQRTRRGNRQQHMTMVGACVGHPTTNGNALDNWHLDRQCSEEITHLVRDLLEQMSVGRLGGDRWRHAVHEQLAHHILFVSQMRCASIEECAELPRFWLVLAALAVVTDKTPITATAEWTRWVDVIYGPPTSSRHTSNGRPSTLCDNHDDNRTRATVRCDMCDMALCRECYTVLHLARRNRSHAVRVLEEAIGGVPEMDVHEGCVRLRLPTMLLLFDANTLNGMCEITSANPREMLASSTMSTTSTQYNVCRFCNGDGGDRLTRVCSSDDCQLALRTACTAMHACTHPCQGVVDERPCLPCLRCGDPSLRQDADDLCVICFTDRLGAQPCVQLGDCGHVFHFECVRQTLKRRWNGPRIAFTFAKCPICQTDMRHDLLNELLDPIHQLRDDIRRKAKMRLEYDGLAKTAAVTDPSSAFHDDPLAYALDKYVYVQCAQCHRAYFGGEVQCQMPMGGSEYNAAELLCGGCSNIAGGHVCPRHGTEYLEYKCRFCCSVAIFFCFGTSHFCTGCHDDFHRLMALPKSRLPQCPVGPTCVPLEGDVCPLKITPHPMTGDECALGCAICRNLQTF